MYRKDSTGWIKHVDFIILDLICLQVAFVLAYALSGYGANPYQLILYRNMAVFMEVADLVVLFAMGTLKNVLKRGYYKDFVVTAQHGVILGACLLLYLFIENFMLFVPFSILLLWAFQKELLGESENIRFGKTVWEATKVVAIFSFMIEFTQLLFHLGTFQISDLTYNTLGGAVGGVIYYLGYSRRRKK